MPLFGRRNRQSNSTEHPVAAFWVWWAANAESIDPMSASAAADELTQHVQAIHPDLTWHFGPGAASQHRLTVSASGVAEVRPAAERWLRAAPPADSRWEYRASQEAEPGAMSCTLTITGHEVDLSRTVFRVETVEEELRVHVGVHHPAFAAMPEDVRSQVTFLVLDWVLGEDDVERWLGHIEPLVDAPADATSAADVRAAADALAQDCGPDEWAMAQWQGDDGLVGIATFRRGVRWIDMPTFDRHHVLTRRYPVQSNGLPLDGDVLDEMYGIEEPLQAALGSRGVLIGHESFGGVRTFHVYADGEDQNVDATLKAFAQSHDMVLESQPDPAWSQVRHMTR